MMRKNRFEINREQKSNFIELRTKIGKNDFCYCGSGKKYKGHYCKICGEIKANEQFTGKGHANHICKKCSKKTGAQQTEEIAINRIYKLVGYSNLSKQNREMLEAYLQDKRESVRVASQEVMEMFTSRFRNNSDERDKSTYFLDINYENLSDDLDGIPF